jgi:hypothetical protein
VSAAYLAAVITGEMRMRKATIRAAVHEELAVLGEHAPGETIALVEQRLADRL